MQKQDLLMQIHVERPIYKHEALNQDYDYEKPKSSGKLHIYVTNCMFYVIKYIYFFL